MPKRIIPFGPPRQIFDLQISGNYVVWLEKLTGSPQLLYELHAVNLTNGEQNIIGQGQFSYLSFRDEIAVWRGQVNGGYGVYGYDFSSQQPFTVEQSQTGHIAGLARACNHEWIAYLISTTGLIPHAADLWVYNRLTNEKFSVGQVAITDDPNSSYQHDCDGVNLVWLGTYRQTTGETSHQYNELHYLNLAARTVQTLDRGVSGVPRLSVGGDVALSRAYRNVGYDLLRTVKFDANLDALPSRGTGIPVLLAYETLVWQHDPNGNQGVQFYIASLNRD